jgi:hypothetical protein
MKLMVISKGMCDVLPISFVHFQLAEVKLSADIGSKTRYFSRLWTITSLIRLAARGIRSTPVVAEGAVSRGCGCAQRPL